MTQRIPPIPPEQRRVSNQLSTDLVAEPIDQTKDRALCKFRKPHAVTLHDPAVILIRHFRYGSIAAPIDRKSTRLNSSHDQISYAVFCLKKKKMTKMPSIHYTVPS